VEKNEEPDVYGAPIPTNITEEENMIPNGIWSTGGLQ
jgi:hypothetical protein